MTELSLILFIIFATGGTLIIAVYQLCFPDRVLTTKTLLTLYTIYTLIGWVIVNVYDM